MNSGWDSGDPPDQRPVQGTSGGALQSRIKELLGRAKAAARAGQRGEARRLFRAALALDSTCEEAWLWLGFLAPSPRQSLDYLEQARTYHPESRRVREAMIWAQERLAESQEVPAPRLLQASAEQSRPRAPRPRGAPRSQARSSPPALPPPTRRRPLRRERRRRVTPLLTILLLIALASLAIAVVYRLPLLPRQVETPTPQPGPSPTATLTGDMATLRQMANAAITGEDWEATIPLLERMRELSPEDDGVRQQLAVAHLRCGLQLADRDRLDEAIAHYDAAIRFYANDKDLQTARRLAIGYRDGRRAVQEQRWSQAAELLEPVFKVAPDFRDAADLLFTAYVRQAEAQEATRKLEAARQAYARAVEIKPAASEARAKLAEITRILTPPTPTPTPRPRKRIVISVAKQHLWAYENDNVVFSWICSTGEPARPTQYGSFQILDKIPEAWSSVWGLRMPYWMGIYWAGGSENGIHALPILKNGQLLWAGFLGRKVSFGCIILDTANAARLYKWADIGTPVAIVP